MDVRQHSNRGHNRRHVWRHVNYVVETAREDERKWGTETNVIMNIRHIEFVFYIMKPGSYSCVGLAHLSVCIKKER